ncbi:DegT/DnrJ/EryC1/StrS family aminotransferase [Rickettsiales bacterium LUAb2]
MIDINPTFLPPIEEYIELLTKVWESKRITSNGSLLLSLENKLQDYLKINYLSVVSSGTTALQLALQALNITEGEIITSPFSCVAPISAILWQRCTPVFVDIEPNNFCIDANKIEEKITSKTKAIVAINIFGYACDIEKIESIATKYNLKVIYDGAQAFGAKYKGKSLLNYGDISICSFHATKIFHTIDGGACITNNSELYNKLQLLKNFGQKNNENFLLGINAKVSEFQAAMGICNLKYIDDIIIKRKKASELYDKLLQHKLQLPHKQEGLESNYVYYPVVFESEVQLIEAFARLNKHDIFPRRYFRPVLTSLPYLNAQQSCPIADDISNKIACLPLYHSIGDSDIDKITSLL